MQCPKCSNELIRSILTLNLKCLKCQVEFPPSLDFLRDDKEAVRDFLSGMPEADKEAFRVLGLLD